MKQIQNSTFMLLAYEDKDDDSEPPKREIRRTVEKFRRSSSEASHSASRQVNQLYSDQSSCSSDEDESRGEPIKFRNKKIGEFSL